MSMGGGDKYMIKSILMKNCATYSEEGVKIDNCNKINIFYGPNGSGKSTIGNYLSNKDCDLYDSCNIEWENVGDDNAEIFVYNKKFKTEHFDEDIAGIFTIGKENIEDIRIIEKLKDDRIKISEKYNKELKHLENTTAELNEIQRVLSDVLWKNVYKKNSEDFKELFEGLRGSKDKLKEEIISKYKKIEESSESRENLLKRKNIIFKENISKCQSIILPEDKLITTIKEIETDNVWKRIIVGNEDLPIANLIKELNNSDWINQGRKYIKDNNICPFCQQESLLPDVKRQIEEFFDGEYSRNIEYIIEKTSDYKEALETLINSFENIKKQLMMYSVCEIDKELFSTRIEALRLKCNNNIDKMEKKQREAHTIFAIEESSSILQEIMELLNNANKKIIEYNNIVDNIKEEQEKIKDEIWDYLLTEQSALIKKYLTDIANIEKRKNNLERKTNEYKEQIKKIDNDLMNKTKSLNSVQPTIDEINNILKNFGFTNFKIAQSPDKDNYYQIQRKDGSLASSTLSEGEETFITFLYFMQLLKGSLNEEGIPSRKIVVLDDPVSSLDSSIMYVANSMIQDLIKEIKDSSSEIEQLFIFTHNIYFHKEVSFIGKTRNPLNYVHYWVMSKDDNITYIRSFERENPIKSSYELLWNELKYTTNMSSITIQNIMRRILENYFGILGRKIDETIGDTFTSDEDKIIFDSFIKWINDGSHSIMDDMYIVNDELVPKYMQVFKTIFEKMGHIAHYNMMMKKESGNINCHEAI